MSTKKIGSHCAGYTYMKALFKSAEAVQEHLKMASIIILINRIIVLRHLLILRRTAGDSIVNVKSD